jgi:hypothetical protein
MGMGALGLIAMTTHYVGGVSWERSNGDSGECELDMTVNVDVDAGVRTAQGMFCGEAVDKSWPWPWGWSTPGDDS